MDEGDIDIPESQEFFRPGTDKPVIDKKGVHTFERVVPSTRCHVCNSTMAKVGRKESFFYCIKPECKESQTNASHYKTYSKRLFGSFLFASFFILIGGVLFNNSMPIVYRSEAGWLDIVKFISSFVCFMTGYWIVKGADENAIWNDICDREEAHQLKLQDEETAEPVCRVPYRTFNPDKPRVIRNRKPIVERFPTATRKD